jgi:hypothetical protein
MNYSFGGIFLFDHVNTFIISGLGLLFLFLMKLWVRAHFFITQASWICFLTKSF